MVLYRFHYVPALIWTSNLPVGLIVNFFPTFFGEIFVNFFFSLRKILGKFFQLSHHLRIRRNFELLFFFKNRKKLSVLAIFCCFFFEKNTKIALYMSKNFRNLRIRYMWLVSKFVNLFFKLQKNTWKNVKFMWNFWKKRVFFKNFTKNLKNLRNVPFSPVIFYH